MNVKLEKTPTINDLAKNGAKTMIEVVVSKLREDILSGHLVPESRLPVEHLRKEFNVGGSTIREALSRLMSESLVTTEGQRGFRVAPISKKDFHDIAEMRKLLEIDAVQTSIRIGDEEWENKIFSSFYRLSKVEKHFTENDNKNRNQQTQEWSVLNKNFHDALVGACGNKWLLNFRRILHDQSERYIRLSLKKSDAPRDVHQEHKEIYEAVLDRNADLAGKLIAQHIDRTFEAIS